MTSRRQVIKLPHHDQAELCTTRCSYRQGRRLTAVKVYTVNDESQHLIVSGVPSLGLQDDLRRLCSRFGDITTLVCIPNYSEERFADSYHIRYARIHSARFAKKHLDGRTFFGGSLHVCYAPEMESVTETKSKLQLRRHDVMKRCHNLSSSTDKHQPLHVTSAKNAPDSLGILYDSTRTWNDIPETLDPKPLPAEKLEEVALSTYGPVLLSSDWENCGVRETKFIPHPQPRNKRDYHVQKATTIGSRLAAHASSAWAKSSEMSSTNPTVTLPSPASNKVSVQPVLKLIPTQVKGAGKRIVFHEKNTLVGSCDSPASGSASIDATILSVREQIRLVGVPSVKVVLERKQGTLLQESHR